MAVQRGLILHCHTPATLSVRVLPRKQAALRERVPLRLTRLHLQWACLELLAFAPTTMVEAVDSGPEVDLAAAADSVEAAGLVAVADSVTLVRQMAEQA